MGPVHACDIVQKKREIKCLFDYAKKRQEVLNEVNRWVRIHRLFEAYTDLSTSFNQNLTDLGNVISFLEDLQSFDLVNLGLRVEDALRDVQRRLLSIEMDFVRAAQEFRERASEATFVAADDIEYAKIYFNVLYDFYTRKKQQNANVNHTYCLVNLRIEGAMDPWEHLSEAMDNLTESMRLLAEKHVRFKWRHFSETCNCGKHPPCKEEADDYSFEKNHLDDCQEAAALFELHEIVGCETDDCTCKEKEPTYAKYLAHKKKRTPFWILELVLECPVSKESTKL